MMNNKSIFSLLVAMTILASCSKIPELSDQPFTITIKSVQSQAVWTDIVPETNDFNYNFGTVTVEDYEEKYCTDDALIQAIDKKDKDNWEKYLKDKMSFRDAYLYNGAYFNKGSSLEPETDYYVFAFPYDKEDKPICKVVKQRFTTKAYTPSEIDFTVTLQGSEISIVPSNDDESYYFDYDTVESVDNNFEGSPSMFYYYLIYKYEEYGFMAGITTKGANVSDIEDFFKIKPDQEFYLVASAYNNEVNSPYRIFKLKYVGEDLPGEVEVFEDPLYDSADAKEIFGRIASRPASISLNISSKSSYCNAIFKFRDN